MSVTVAVDARMVRDSGIGTYIRGVLPRVARLRPDWRLRVITRRSSVAGLGWEDIPNVELVDARSPIYSLGQQIELASRARGAALFWSPHYDAPLFAARRLVVTIHDVFHLADSGGNGGARALVRRGYARTMYAAVVRRADAVICDSEFTRAELERLVGRPRGAVEVIHLGVDPLWSEADGEEGGSLQSRPYLLFVGNLKPHKNLRVLLDAFERIAEKVPHDLVVVGRHEGMRTVDSEVQARAARMNGRVIIAGELDESSLRQRVRDADALVFPSFYEGFGLPPLEAMMAGTPCIVSTAASIPEVCGDAALYFDPSSAEELAGRISQLLADEALRETLRRRGREHAGRFRWEAAAERTTAVLEGALSR